jgi:MFS family permease
MTATTGRYYPWIVLVLLIALYTSSFIDRSIFGLLVKPIRADLNITDTEYSLLAGLAFAVTYTFAGIPMGWIVDNGSRRMLIAVGCAVWSFMTALCGMANSFGTLFAARVGVGIGEAVLSPAAYSLLSDLFPKEKLARALSFYSLGIPIGSGLALMIGGSVVDYFAGLELDLPLIGTPRPWQTVFLVIGLPGLILALLTPLIIKEPKRKAAANDPDRSNLLSVLRHMWRHRGVYALVIGGVTAAAIGGYGAMTWMPTYMQRVHGFTAGDAGLFLGISTIALGVPGTMLSGWMADKLITRGRGDGHLLVALFYVAGLFICGFLAPLIPDRDISLFLVAGFGFFIFTWVGVPTALLQIVTPIRMRGQVSALYLFSTGLFGIGVGPTAMGAATDYIFKADDAVGKSIFLVGAISTVIAVTLFITARRYLPKAAADLKVLSARPTAP